MAPSNRAELDFEDVSPNASRLKIFRSHGFFTTYTALVALIVFYILSLLIVSTVIHYFSSQSSTIPIDKNIQILNEINEKLEKLNTEHNSTYAKLIRLPKTIQPIKYKLKIQPIFDEDPINNFTFHGEVRITLNALEANIKQIELHSSQLTISTKQVRLLALDIKKRPAELKKPRTPPIIFNQTGPFNFTVTPHNDIFSARERASTDADLIEVDQMIVPIRKHTFSIEFEKYFIQLDQVLEIDRNYTLIIPFNGTLLQSLEGFYAIPYTENDIVKSYAVTQFEPTFARRAFPCFDEPAFKAPFEISIARSKHMISLSNAALRVSEPMKNSSIYIWDHYEITPPMSTYVVSFMVGDFVCDKRKLETVHNVTIRVWTRRNLFKRDDKLYIEHIAPILLDYYTDLFEIKYPFNKLDIVGAVLPISGMENWGLIMIKEELIFKNDSIHSQHVKEPILILLAHEIIHQWIGNLVSINWWSDIWIKEGLTSYFEIFAPNQLEPHWNINDSFILNNINYVLSVDRTKSKRQVNAPVLNPLEIIEHFEGLVYQKGASIYRMLNYTLSEPVFLDGIRIFLRLKAFKTADENDLWTALNFSIQMHNISIFNDTNFGLVELMHNWIHKPGIPLIQVHRNYENDTAIITQQRFLHNVNASDETIWNIPLSYVIQNTDGEIHNLFIDQSSLLIKNLTNNIDTNSSQWVLFNPLETGLYRVNYDTENWRKLTLAINKQPKSFPTAVRAQLIDDALNVAQLDLIDYGVALNFTKFLANEDDVIPWITWMENLQFIEDIVSDDSIFGIFQDYILSIVGPRYINPKPNPTIEDKNLHDFLRTVACKYENNDCVQWALNEFKKLETKIETVEKVIEQNYQDVVYCTAIALGQKREWELLWTRGQFISTSNNQAEYSVILSSLGCSRTRWILRRYLEYIFLENRIDQNHITNALRGFRSKLAVDVLFKFTQEHFHELYDKANSGLYLESHIYKLAFWRLNTQEQLDQLLNLYKDHEDELQPHLLTISEAIERTKSKIQWNNLMAKQVGKWLRTTLN